MRRLLLALAMLLLLPAVAQAAPPTVIDFNGLPQNEAVDDDFAAQGVRFGAAADFGLPSPELDCGGGFAATGGINATSNQIACRSGPVEFPTRRFATAFEFQTERRDVRFNLQQRAVDGSLSATLRVYGIGATLLEQRTVTLPRNVTQNVVVTRATAQIAAITLSGTGLGSNDSGPVLLDDLVALLDDVPPPPKWSVAVTTPSVEVVEGASVSAALSVRRFNGSSGPVTLTVAGLPAGIRAAQLEPNPAVGSNPVALRLSANRPFAAQRQVTVTASGGGPAGTGVVTSGVVTVQGIPAVQIAEGGRFTRSVVAGCGPQRFRESFTVRGGLVEDVLPQPSAPGGMAVSTTPSLVTTSGDGLYSYDLLVDPLGTGGIQPVTLRAAPINATRASLDVAFRVVGVSVTAVSPTRLARPRLGATGTVQVRGRFPDSCAITFQDGAGTTWPVVTRGSTDVDGSVFDLWTLQAPQAAVSGPLRAIGATGAEVGRSPAVEVTEFRNGPALAGLNGGPGARTGSYSWADFERTFGDDDTESCFIVCVTDAHAREYYRRWRDQVQANPGTGLCSGWTQMAIRFQRGDQRPSDFGSNAPRAWAIPSSQVDGTAVKRDVVRWQVAQFDASFQEERVRAFARTPAEERAVIKGAVASGQRAYIGIRQGTGGHAVVAYDAQDITTPTGPGLTVAIYDPNVPYTPAEEAPGGARAAANTSSTITIQGNGSWAGSGFPWSGNNGTLMATTSLPPVDAELPTSSGFIGSVFSSSGDGSGAQITQIEAGGRPTLDGQAVPRPGTGVTLRPTFSGVAAVPEYGLAPGREYALTATGTGSATYEHGVIGGGASATVLGARTTRGQQDVLTVRPGTAGLRFAGRGARATVELAVTDRVGRATRSATISAPAGRGLADDVTLTGGVLRLRHTGPATTVRVRLASSGAGLPGGVSTAGLRVGAGQRLELRPRAWSDLQAGVRLTVRDRRGRVLRRGSARLRATSRVALSGVRARSAGRRVVVRGRVGRRGSQPLLAVVVEQVRGRRVVARKVATRRDGQVRRGAFSLPVTVGARRSKTRLRVTVTLLDQAADLASVRRRITPG